MIATTVSVKTTLVWTTSPIARRPAERSSRPERAAPTPAISRRDNHENIYLFGLQKRRLLREFAVHPLWPHARVPFGPRGFECTRAGPKQRTGDSFLGARSA